MKKKLRMYYYRLTAKLIDFKNFIINTYKKMKESPFSFFYSFAGILIIFFIIFGIVLLASGKSDSKDITAEADNASLYAEAVAATIEETKADKVTTAENITTESETTTAPQLIDISEITISNVDLSEKDNKQNAVSNSDAPVYTDPNPSINFSPKDYSSVIYGIDVSKWQGNINWQKVADAGYKFVFVKVAGRGTAYGTLYYDDMYKKNIEGALAAGLDVGVYIFSQAITEREALEEASLIIDAIKGYNITYPVVFDWETGYHSGGSPYRSNGAKLSNSQMTKIVNTFINAVEGAGYEAMVYGNAYDLSLFDITSVAKNHKVWYARYWTYYRNYDNYFIPGKETPVTSFPYQIWQYKDTGIVPGIPEKVDMNVAFISSTINITVKKDTIYTLKNSTVDLLGNVSAINSTSKDVTDYVTYTIKDAKGNNVSLSRALSTVGNYTVTYEAVYLSEISNNPTVKLIVCTPPVLTAKYSELTLFDSSDNEITTNDIALFINTTIRNNITRATDFNNKDISGSVDIILPTPMYMTDADGNYINDINDNTVTEAGNPVLINGIYSIHYSVKDLAGYKTDKLLTINLVGMKSDNITFTLDDITYAGFKNTLDNALKSNLNIYKSNINIEYDVALSEKLSALSEGINSFEANEEFSVAYTIHNDILGTLVKYCTVTILPASETTSDEFPSDEPPSGETTSAESPTFEEDTTSFSEDTSFENSLNRN